MPLAYSRHFTTEFQCLVNVCSWHKADIARVNFNVRFWGKADIGLKSRNVDL
jgi:hypothetical protein